MERHTFSFYRSNSSQLPLSEDNIITLPFSCRAKETWIDNVEPSFPLDTALHVVNVKTFGGYKENKKTCVDLRIREVNIAADKF